MKNFLICLSILTLFGSVVALPMTTATDRQLSASSLSGQSRQIAQTKSRGSAPATAADKAKSRTDNSKKSASKPKRAVPITAEMEQEVRKFVGEHHPELLDVLANLKNGVPKEYERAVRDLHRTRLRFRQLEGRDRYEAELNLWKAESRARLLGARFLMGDDSSSRDALRKVLTEIYDLRTELLERDRERTAERLKKLDEQLATLNQQRAENLEKQLTALTKNAQKRAKSVPTSARQGKPASSKKQPVKKPSVKPID